MTDLNVGDIMREIPNHFDAEKAKGVSGVVQCSFTGAQASDWVVTIKDQTCTVEEKWADQADLTIKADAQDGVQLLTGQLDPMRAYMLGKVKVIGDMSLGMKFVNLFNR